MPILSCQLLPLRSADGPTQMAADEALLEHAAFGRASLRFYTWEPATLSLGYFQLAADGLGSLPYVRRASGGGAIVHHYELTYALALPPGSCWQTGDRWVCRMHDIIRTALVPFDITGTLVGCGHEVGRGAFLCFEHQTPGDLLLNDCKIVGSAQRRRAGALLQHGSILLGASPHAPHLPGVGELTGQVIDAAALADALGRAFVQETGWLLKPAAWLPLDERVAALAAGKYRQPAWNDKR